MRVWPAVIVACAGTVARSAAADVSSFRLSEVMTASANNDSSVRYIEIEATADACVFPSTRVVSYDPAGNVSGDAAPFASATCIGAGSFLLLATPAAQALFAVTADGSLVPPLPPVAGQVCLVSSATRYDCVRWNHITTPIHDLFGPTDDTMAFGAPGGLALARVAATDVIAIDWRVETPTPRAPNDGSPWDPGDAGVDAAPPIDAGTDAVTVDAPRLDASRDAPELDGNQRFLDLDPVGGAGCGCNSGSPVDGLAPLGLLAVALRRRSQPAGRPDRRKKR